MATPRICQICKTKLKPWQLNACSQEHRDALRNSTKVRSEYLSKDVPEAEVVIRKSVPQIMSDEEQRAINMAIDKKYDFSCECRTIKPGDPEFDAIAATVTPVEQITNIAHNGVTGFWEENL